MDTFKNISPTFTKQYKDIKKHYKIYIGHIKRNIGNNEGARNVILKKERRKIEKKIKIIYKTHPSLEDKFNIRRELILLLRELFVYNDDMGTSLDIHMLHNSDKFRNMIILYHDNLDAGISSHESSPEDSPPITNTTRRKGGKKNRSSRKSFK